MNPQISFTARSWSDSHNRRTRMPVTVGNKNRRSTDMANSENKMSAQGERSDGWAGALVWLLASPKSLQDRSASVVFFNRNVSLRRGPQQSTKFLICFSSRVGVDAPKAVANAIGFHDEKGEEIKGS